MPARSSVRNQSKILDRQPTPGSVSHACLRSVFSCREHLQLLALSEPQRIPAGPVIEVPYTVDIFAVARDGTVHKKTNRMSQLNIDIPHQLSQEEALARIRNLLSNLKEEQKDVISDVSEHWQGSKGDFSFSARGFNLAGNIEVNPSNVSINADLPFALSFFKGMISNVITQKATALLK